MSRTGVAGDSSAPCQPGTGSQNPEAPLEGSHRLLREPHQILRLACLPVRLHVCSLSSTTTAGAPARLPVANFSVSHRFIPATSEPFRPRHRSTHDCVNLITRLLHQRCASRKAKIAFTYLLPYLSISESEPSTSPLARSLARSRVS